MTHTHTHMLYEFKKGLIFSGGHPETFCGRKAGGSLQIEAFEWRKVTCKTCLNSWRREFAYAREALGGV